MQTAEVLPSILALAVITVALSGAATTPKAQNFVMKVGFGMFAALLVIVLLLILLLRAGVLAQATYEIVLFAAVAVFFVVLIPVTMWANGRLASMREADRPDKSA